MSNEPTTSAVGQSEIQCQGRLGRVLAAVSIFLVFCVSVASLTVNSAADLSRASTHLEFATPLRHNIPDLVIVPSHDDEIPDMPWLLAGDSRVFVETEDFNPLEKNPGDPQAFPEASHIALGDLSSHDSPRAPFLPVFATHGLMSRRF